MIKFNIEKRTMPKILINIGSLFDIPTSSIVTGKEGESIFNGGLGHITSIVGAGNNFKSTIAYYMMLSAANRIKSSTDTAMTVYDTEVNISMDRLESLAKGFEHLPNDIFNADNIWTITDKSMMSANDWAMNINNYTEEKAKDKSSMVTYQCFLDPYTKKPLHCCVPTFVDIDSLSAFEGKATMEMLTKDLDSSDTNTYAMKQGLFKTKFISTLPVMANSSNTYFLLTAHLGKEVNMATGPAMYSQPTKKLQYLKSGDAIKGVGSNFTFFTTSSWYAHTASLLINQNTGLAEYPLDENDKQKTDLNIVRLTQLRAKSGPSGYTISVILSQVEGVLPTLTEFHYIKENARFGISGNNTTYHLDLYPELTLSRPTVRSKINSDPKLRRAINMTSELLQSSIFHSGLREDGLICTPLELYEDIKKLGYDWNILLNTRGYWTIDQYDNVIPYLSIIDLLKMRKGLYFPYFLNKDKTLKDKYIKKDKKK